MSVKRIALFVGSLGGVGYLRPASGTWGSLLAAAVLFFFWPALAVGTKVAIIVAGIVLGSLLANSIQRLTKTKDPYFFVVDELLGMMIVAFFAEGLWQWVAAFLLFRLLDIVKPWPASWFDNRTTGWDAMLDDVIAAAYALAILSFFVAVL